MIVHVSQHVYSNVPGRVGNWSYAADLDLPAAPGVGDYLIIPLSRQPDEDGYEGEHTEPVHQRFIGPGHIHVQLRPVKTDNPAILDELAERLQAGWEQSGGPWADQPAV
jgi:hypothetical protein